MLGMFLGKLLEKFLFPLQPAWPFESTFATCGSTGPITAVLVLFALKYWDQPIRFFAIAMPAWAAIAIVLSVGLLLSLSHQDRGEILSANGFGILSAWLYHRSGIRIVDRLPRLTRSSGATPQRLSRLKLVPAQDDEPTASEGDERLNRRLGTKPVGRDRTATVVDEQLEAKLDRVLDKVAKTGTGSLSNEEREILLKASEVYKRRRGG